MPDAHDLIHKACGWLLREAGKSDAARLERYLLEHRSAIPRTTVRYAIERFPESKRQRILQETRSAEAMASIQDWKG
jgi:3-methyladenine DNA glycosylase AlkD